MVFICIFFCWVEKVTFCLYFLPISAPAVNAVNLATLAVRLQHLLLLRAQASFSHSWEAHRASSLVSGQ